jgi:hypothetical protein
MKSKIDDKEKSFLNEYSESLEIVLFPMKNVSDKRYTDHFYLNQNSLMITQRTILSPYVMHTDIFNSFRNEFQVYVVGITISHHKLLELKHLAFASCPIFTDSNIINVMSWRLITCICKIMNHPAISVEMYSKFQQNLYQLSAVKANDEDFSLKTMIFNENEKIEKEQEALFQYEMQREN